MLRVDLLQPPRVSELEPLWRDLEARATPSFFQTWAWVGCLAAERFPNPVLLHATEAGRTVALALCNRRPAPLAPHALHLGESGDPALDAIYVEHNGPLVERGREADLLTPCIEALLHAPIGGRRRGRALVLAGVGARVLAAARAANGTVHIRRESAAPWVHLPSLRSGLLASLSPSARGQLRRSARLYQALGEASVTRAGSTAEALAWLDAMAVWHQRTWQARGRPGAFANPHFVRFHRTLLARSVADGGAHLLRVAFGSTAIGYLYNLCAGDQVCAYQSGFDYAFAAPHQKPGLTSHHYAIEHYRVAGAAGYDFLAGNDRYKTTLANRTSDLYWLEVLPHGSRRGAWLALQRAARRARMGVAKINMLRLSC